MHRRRISSILVLVTALSALQLGIAPDASRPKQVTRPDPKHISYRNPLQESKTGQPVSCPDPSVSRQNRRYVLVCTSDNATDAFPIWVSSDLVHWARDGFVFPHGRQPWWAVPSTGAGRQGIYWGPEIYIYRFGGRWVVYFAAQYNSASHALPLAAGKGVTSGTMVIGVATAAALAGPWHTRILHYPLVNDGHAS